MAPAAPLTLKELVAVCARPSVELVAEVGHLIDTASREDFEAFRYETAEALKTCGASDSFLSSCGDWATTGIREGRYTPEQAGVMMMHGMMACAFQLGLLAATAALLRRSVS